MRGRIDGRRPQASGTVVEQDADGVRPPADAATSSRRVSVELAKADLVRVGDAVNEGAAECPRQLREHLDPEAVEAENTSARPSPVRSPIATDSGPFV